MAVGLKHVDKPFLRGPKVNSVPFVVKFRFGARAGAKMAPTRIIIDI